jgi:hypothetical protein
MKYLLKKGLMEMEKERKVEVITVVMMMMTTMLMDHSLEKKKKTVTQHIIRMIYGLFF